MISILINSKKGIDQANTAAKFVFTEKKNTYSKEHDRLESVSLQLLGFGQNYHSQAGIKTHKHQMAKGYLLFYSFNNNLDNTFLSRFH